MWQKRAAWCMIRAKRQGKYKNRLGGRFRVCKDCTLMVVFLVLAYDGHRRASFGGGWEAYTIGDIRRNTLRALIPPPRLRLSEWIEANIKLPEGGAARRHQVVLVSARDCRFDHRERIRFSLGMIESECSQLRSI
jgi:hypothetical protein